MQPAAGKRDGSAESNRTNGLLRFFPCKSLGGCPRYSSVNLSFAVRGNCVLKDQLLAQSCTSARKRPGGALNYSNPGPLMFSPMSHFL